MSSVMFTESLAALRKNRVHIVFTAQSSHQVPLALPLQRFSGMVPAEIHLCKETAQTGQAEMGPQGSLGSGAWALRLLQNAGVGT